MRTTFLKSGLQSSYVLSSPRGWVLIAPEERAKKDLDVIVIGIFSCFTFASARTNDCNHRIENETNDDLISDVIYIFIFILHILI